VSELFAHENPTAKVLDQLLRDMKLRLDDDPRCCLGSGRLGSVFRVCGDDGRNTQGCMALKVVAGSHHLRRLGKEFSNNKAIWKLRPGVILKAIAIRCYGQSSHNTVGAGMLMDEVGSAVPCSDRSLFKALRALVHLHQTGYWHGSARIDTLLACRDLFKWCDVQRAGTDEDDSNSVRNSFEIDIQSLLYSYCYRPQLPPDFNYHVRRSSALEAYAANPTMEGLLTFAAEIGFALELVGEEERGAQTAEPDHTRSHPLCRLPSPSCGVTF
jgi:hypothetical protein